jgi:Ohr subfamily peroxiredoxin
LLAKQKETSSLQNKLKHTEEPNQMKTLYETTVINTGGRQGIVQSPDNVFMLDVAAPPELGGKVTTATNPEQLFAAGYSACFNSALEFQLKKHKVEIEKSTVSATVMLVTDPTDNGVKLEVELEVKIEGLDEETAQKFVKLAHDYCPYSKGIKGNVNVSVELA